MKRKSKDYIKGFKHGIAWACKILYINLIQIEKAIKSLKEGR